MGAQLPLQADPRVIIAQLWPEHAKHLSPPGNAMGGGKIDPEEGVVCNCGEVLGFPQVQDEADYVTAESDRPDTSGAQTGEPGDEMSEEEIQREHDRIDRQRDLTAPGDEATADEAGWNDLVGQGDEAQAGPPYAVGDSVTVAGMEFTKHSESPFPEHNPTGYVDGDEDHHTYVNPDGSVEAHDGPVSSCRCGCGSGPRSPLADQMIIEQRGATQRAADADQGQAEGQPRWRPVPTDPDGFPRDHSPESKALMPARDSGVVDAEDPITARVVTIDPSMPYGPMDVEHQLLDIAGRIERGVHYQRYWEERAYAAEMAHTLANARAMASARGGSADVRKAQVVLATYEELAELKLCEAMVKAVRETLHNLRSLQSGYQTVSRSVSDSMRSSQRGA